MQDILSQNIHIVTSKSYRNSHIRKKYSQELKTAISFSGGKRNFSATLTGFFRDSFVGLFYWARADIVVEIMFFVLIVNQVHRSNPFMQIWDTIQFGLSKESQKNLGRIWIESGLNPEAMARSVYIFRSFQYSSRNEYSH